jgi:hypothetical protein
MLYPMCELILNCYFAGYMPTVFFAFYSIFKSSERVYEDESEPVVLVNKTHKQSVYRNTFTLSENYKQTGIFIQIRIRKL